MTNYYIWRGVNQFILGGGAFWKVIRIRWIQDSKALLNGISVLVRARREDSFLYLISTTWRYKEKWAVCNPEESSSELKYAGSQISNFRLQSCEKHVSAVYKLCSLWYFVTAAELRQGPCSFGASWSCVEAVGGKQIPGATGTRGQSCVENQISLAFCQLYNPVILLTMQDELVH